ncbi:hypothetical protein CTI14_64295, partial [Methylobacterium radiotolerans]
TARGDKNQSSVLLEKVVNEMKSRITARVHKETQAAARRRSESSTLPAWRRSSAPSSPRPRGATRTRAPCSWRRSSTR